jgi:Holliday junction resolvase RusA-like endonuclease
MGRAQTVLLVPGEPSTVTAQHKGISFRRRQVYTLAVIKAERHRIERDLLIMQEGVFTRPKYPVIPYSGPLYCAIEIIYALSLDQAKRLADKLSDSTFTLRHAVRPDVDNSAKLILDVLTGRGFWHDDSQIDELRITKRYGSEPRITIWIVSEGP